jgi:hypothetical protein
MKNKNVVYSGKVGAKMKPRIGTRRPGCIKSANQCQDGPMKGHFLYLVSSHTLPVNYRGEVGRYVSGVWEVVK